MKIIKNDNIDFGILKESIRDPNFKIHLERLDKLTKELNDCGTDFVKRTIVIARVYNGQRKMSCDLDRETSALHRRLLLKVMRNISKISDAQIQNRYRTIAEQADKLCKFVEFIPRCQESIYQIAVAAENHQPIQQWIDDGRLTAKCTLAEIKALRGVKQLANPQKSIHFS